MRLSGRLESAGRRMRGWLPREPVMADLHAAPRPWWWRPAWSMGFFMAETALLNTAVPVSTLSPPLFLANMWLCFMAGWALAGWIGKKRDYQPLPPEPRWKARMRRFVILPMAGAELAIGLAFFSLDNWRFVLTNCWTGNVCTFAQLAPVMLLPLGAGILILLAILELAPRFRA